MRWKRVSRTGNAAPHRGRAAVGLALAVGAVVLAGCASSGSAPSAEGVDALLGATRADHAGTGRGLREADRHHGQRAQRRRGRPGRSDRHGRLALTRRRVLHREHAATAGTGLQGTPGQRGTVHPGQHAVPLQLARRQVGGGDGPRQRHGVQHVPSHPESAPDVGDGSGRPAVEGQDRHRRAPRPTSNRSSPRSPGPTARRLRCSGWKRSRRTQAVTAIPTTRPSSRRSIAGRWRSALSTSTTGTVKKRRSATRGSTRPSPTSPRTTPGT